MRKQTKVVAVASAAALLAIGASMTSFAATGWVEEDGTWYFYDSDGNRVEDTWKKSGDNWYWLDAEEGGAMAIDKLVEDDDDTYYVDSNGVMVRNTWVKVVNEDQDDESDPAEYIYYYMQGNGKAYKTKSDSTQFKTIDGKRYAFDEDGKMLYGWINETHERVDAENWYDEGVYYLGQWDDGAMKTGWQKIYVQDNDDDDEEKEFWFNFKSNGQKRTGGDTVGEITEKKINGKKYGFDYRGVMTSQWTIVRTYSDVVASGSGVNVKDWKYFSSPEDGALRRPGSPEDAPVHLQRSAGKSGGGIAAQPVPVIYLHTHLVPHGRSGPGQNLVQRPGVPAAPPEGGADDRAVRKLADHRPAVLLKAAQGGGESGQLLLRLTGQALLAAHYQKAHHQRPAQQQREQNRQQNRHKDPVPEGLAHPHPHCCPSSSRHCRKMASRSAAALSRS